MRALLAGLVLALMSAACDGGGDPEVNDVPYTGEVFPAAALPFAWPTGPYALLTNNGSDTLSVVDLVNRTLVGSLPVGLNPIDNDGPHHLVYDKARGDIYVALAYPPAAFVTGPHAQHGSSVTPGKVVRLSASTGQITAVSRADDNPGDIGLSADGSRLVVSHFDLAKALANASQPVAAQRASLLLYDPGHFGPSQAPRSFPVCVAPHGLALSAGDGRHAYTACYGEDSLAVVDLAADPDKAVTLVPVGPAAQTSPAPPHYGPYAAVLTPDGKQVLIGDTEGHDLRVFDTTSNSMASEVYAAGGGVYFPGVRADGQMLAVPVQTPSFIALVRHESGALVEASRRTFVGDECVAPHEALYWNNDQEILLVCEGDHALPGVSPGKLLFLDPATLEVRASVSLGIYPDKAVVVTP